MDIYLDIALTRPGFDLGGFEFNDLTINLCHSAFPYPILVWVSTRVDNNMFQYFLDIGLTRSGFEPRGSNSIT